MGLGSFFKKTIGKVSKVDPVTGLQKKYFDIGKGWLGDITGQNGADAAMDAANMQAAQFQKVFDLYRPIVEAGQQQLAPLAQSATVSGFSNNIGDILSSGQFGALRQQRQRAATQQFAQTGLRRAGAAGARAADIDTDLALQIESELNRRRQSILSGGQTGIGGASGALQGIGSSLAGGQLGAAQSQAQGTQNMMAIGGALMAAFSDRRLKKNARKIGKIGKADVFAWDWNDLANEIGLDGDSVGLMADQIKKLHPECVITVGGFDMIDYPRALEELRNAA